MEGWIKFHRQTMQNPVFRKDPNAWHVFEVLMLLADHRTGTWSGGRFQLATYANVNANSIKDMLKRLQHHEMITIKSTNKYSTYSICNWARYQGNDTNKNTTSVTNKTPTKHHSNKKLPTNVGSKELKNKPHVDLQKQIRHVYEFYINTFGKDPNRLKLTEKRKTHIRSRLDDYPMDDILLAIKNARNDDFFMGGGNRGWKGDIDYLMRSTENIEKYLEIEGQIQNVDLVERLKRYA